MPCPAKYSASASVETVMPPGCPAVASRATSTDFAVFMCGRSGTPCRRQCARHGFDVAHQDATVEHQARRREIGELHRAHAHSPFPCGRGRGEGAAPVPPRPTPPLTARPQQFRDPRRCLQAAAGEHQHRGLFRRDRRRRPAACQRPRRPGRRSVRRRCPIRARSSVAAAISASLSITAPPRVSRNVPSTSGSRIGCAIAVPSAMVG